MSVLINKDTTPNKLWLTALKLSAALPRAKAVKPT